MFLTDMIAHHVIYRTPDTTASRTANRPRVNAHSLLATDKKPRSARPRPSSWRRFHY